MLNIGTGACALDISRAASIARFAEHSRTPTCELQSWLVDGVPRLAIITKVALGPGETVTVDYTLASVGARQSHLLSDWILLLRGMRCAQVWHVHMHNTSRCF